LLIFFVICTVQVVTFPVLEGSDEALHYGYARYLVNKRAVPLPRTFEQIRQGKSPEPIVGFDPWQETTQPPAYYFFVALATAWVPNADDATGMTRDNFAYYGLDPLGLPFDNKITTINEIGPNRENAFPWKGYVLGIRVGRMVSVLMGVIAVLAVFLAARELNPANRLFPLLAGALAAGVPQFAHISSTVNSDIGVAMFCMLTLWWSLRLIRLGPTLPRALIGGAFAGLAVMSKVNGLLILPVYGVAILLAAWVHREPRNLGGLFKKALPFAVVTGVVILVVGGWWFARNWLTFGHVLELSTHTGESGGIYPQAVTHLFDTYLPDLERTFWYSPGIALLRPPDWFATLLRVTYGVAFICALAKLAMFIRRRESLSPMLAAQLSCVLVCSLVALAGSVYWILTTLWGLGRLFYPTGLMGIALFGAYGLDWGQRIVSQRITGQRIRVGLRMLYGAALLAGAVVGVIYTSIAFNRHPMILNQVPDDVTRTRVTFYDADNTPVAALIGYRIDTKPLSTGDIAIGYLCWQSLGYTQRSFPYALQFVGPDDTVIGARNSYHGLGTYPLSHWQPNEQFCDVTSLKITGDVPKPRAYRVVVSLFDYDTRTAVPLAARDANDTPLQVAQIGQVRVGPTQTLTTSTPLYTLGDAISLASAQAAPGPGDTLSVTLRWVALGSPAQDDKIFLHVLDGAGNIVAQSDHRPDGDWFPTQYWQKGDVIDDAFQVTLPEGTSLDALTLNAGMYDSASGLRLPAVRAETGERMKDDALPLTITQK
jgi:hypothetical protein